MEIEGRREDRLVWGAPTRNREPILGVLERVFPEQGCFLELASGTGQHASFFCSQHPAWRWQPTDIEPENLASIRAYRTGLENLLEPRFVDVVDASWTDVFESQVFDGVFCANMIHIAPIGAMHGLLSRVHAVLGDGASLVLYGPFRHNGQHTSESNARFHASLQSRDPTWGVRNVGEVTEAAERGGLSLVEQVAMPANNQCLIFCR